MDLTDLQKKRETLIKERIAIEEKHATLRKTFNDNLVAGSQRIHDIHLQIQMLDKALANPEAAASIAAFIVSQSAQPNSEK